MNDRGAELREKYGTPEMLEPDVSGRVFVWAHDSEEAARAFVTANIESGFEAWADQRNGRWCSVVDAGPLLDRIGNSLDEV